MCEYCREYDVVDLIDTMVKLSRKRDFYPGIRAYVDRNTIEICSISDTYEPNFNEASIEINFCPKCGRDLRKESEE